MAKTEAQLLAGRVRKLARKALSKEIIDTAIQTVVDQETQHLIITCGSAKQAKRLFAYFQKQELWCEGAVPAPTEPKGIELWLPEGPPPPSKRARKKKKGPEPIVDDNPQIPLEEESESGIAYRKVIVSRHGDATTLTKVAIMKIDLETHHILEVHLTGENSNHPIPRKAWKPYIAQIIDMDDWTSRFNFVYHPIPLTEDEFSAQKIGAAFSVYKKGHGPVKAKKKSSKKVKRGQS